MKFINPLVILRILSTILFMETISFLFCLPVAQIYNEPFYPFLWSALITITISVVFFVISRNSVSTKINIREGFLAVSLSWLFFSAFGSLPFIFSDTLPSFVDAIFESTSGFTTTGSSVIDDVENLPYSINFWRALTNWIGGLGIILLVIIILPTLKISGYQLLTLESSLRVKIHPKTKSIGYRLLIIYLGLTAIQIILLNIGDMDFFDSVCHSFSTLATGGFSTKNTSISGYSPYSQYIIALFMILGGVSFVIYYYMVKMNFKKVRQNEEFWFYLAVIIVTGGIATLVIYGTTGNSFEPAFRIGFFQTISILTTTGFTTTDYLTWPPAGLFMIFILLFAGACTGSTTGNIKMARHLIILKNIKNVFNKLLHPNAFSQIKLNGNPIDDRTNLSIISFVILYIFTFIAGTVIIVFTGIDPITAASTVATSLGNTGPGLGTVGPMFTYSHMTDFCKITFSLLMIIGRLEVNTVFVIFGRSFWKI
jgi:trk system potassium uptake protein